MARQIAKNPDGTLTVDGKYQIGKNDPRFPKFSGMYDTQRAQPTGVSVTGQGGQYTSGTGQKDLRYNYNDESYTRTVGNKQFNVPKGDPRTASIASDYANQNGGVYASGSVSDPTGYGIYSQLLNDRYNNSRKAAQGQIDAAVNTLKSGIDTANNTYNNANKAAYLSYMQGQKNLNQQLAAAGLGKTGASESTRLAAQSGYQNNVNSNEQERAQALQDIYNKIAETQAGGAVTLADIDKELGNNLGNAYLSQLSADRQQLNADREYRLSEDSYNKGNMQDMLDRMIDMGMSPQQILAQWKNLYPSSGVTLDDLSLYKAQRNQSLKYATR
ncbi:MAG: hypothetical protein ACOX7J_03025 [Bacillota bacterium]|jgi:hypothetical protein